jgi:anti-anti-sigma regulatory factor
METVELTLPAQLDIGALQSLKEELLAAAALGGELAIDGSQVERAGTPAVQLLLAAARSFSRNDRRFALLSPSQTLSAAFTDLGLSAELRQWSAS